MLDDGDEGVKAVCIAGCVGEGTTMWNRGATSRLASRLNQHRAVSGRWKDGCACVHLLFSRTVHVATSPIRRARHSRLGSWDAGSITPGRRARWHQSARPRLPPGLQAAALLPQPKEQLGGVKRCPPHAFRAAAPSTPAPASRRMDHFPSGMCDGLGRVTLPSPSNQSSDLSLPSPLNHPHSH